jgi:hypothetical protein
MKASHPFRMAGLSLSPRSSTHFAIAARLSTQMLSGILRSVQICQQNAISTIVAKIARSNIIAISTITASAAASAGGTDRDLAGSQFPRKLRTIQYYRVLNIINLKLYNVL